MPNVKVEFRVIVTQETELELTEDQLATLKKELAAGNRDNLSIYDLEEYGGMRVLQETEEPAKGTDAFLYVNGKLSDLYNVSNPIAG